jgi:hypothetical protein
LNAGAGVSQFFFNGSYLLKNYVILLSNTDDFVNYSSVLVQAAPGKQFYTISFTQLVLESKLRSSLLGKSVFFQVIAQNLIGNGRPSAPVFSRLISIPSVPASLDVCQDGAGVFLRWSMPVDTGDGTNIYALKNFLVEMDTNNFTACPGAQSSCRSPKLVVGSCSCFLVSPLVSTFRPKNLTRNVLYSFRVFAQNEAGIGGATVSNTVKALELPMPPAISNAEPNSNAVGLNWVPPLDCGLGTGIINGTGCGFFSIEYSVLPNFDVSSSTIVAGNFMTVHNLQFGTQYFFRVAALNFAGVGAYSQPIKVVTTNQADIVYTYMQGTDLLKESQQSTPIPALRCNGGADLNIVIQSMMPYSSGTDTCQLLFKTQNSNLVYAGQIKGSCESAKLFYSTVVFAFPQTGPRCALSDTVIASVICNSRVGTAAVGSFPLSIIGSAGPQVRYLFPSFGPAAGNTAVTLGINGFDFPWSEDMLDVYFRISQNSIVRVSKFQTSSNPRTITFLTPSMAAGNFSVEIRQRNSNLTVSMQSFR